MKGINLALLIVICLTAISCFVGFMFLSKKKKEADEKKETDGKTPPAPPDKKLRAAWSKSLQTSLINIGVLTIVVILSAVAFWDKVKTLPGWAIAALAVSIFILFVAGIGTDQEKTIKRGRALAIIVLAVGLIYFWSGDPLNAPTTTAKKTNAIKSADTKVKKFIDNVLSVDSLPPAAVDTRVVVNPGQKIYIQGATKEVPPATIVAKDESGHTFPINDGLVNNVGTGPIKIYMVLPAGRELKDYRFSATPGTGQIKSAVYTTPVLSPASPSGSPCPFEK